MKSNRDTLEYSREHVQLRARQRYGLELTDRDYAAICARAKDFFLGKEKEIQQFSVEQNGDDTQYVLVIPYQAKNLKVVFSKKRDRVTTLLLP